MDWIPIAIPIAGGLLFCLAAVLAVRTVMRAALELPNLARRVAELEGLFSGLNSRTEEAVHTADKAYKIAARRERAKKAAALAEEATGEEEPQAEQPSGWEPGRTIQGREWRPGAAG